MLDSGEGDGCEATRGVASNMLYVFSEGGAEFGARGVLEISVYGCEDGARLLMCASGKPYILHLALRRSRLYQLGCCGEAMRVWQPCWLAIAWLRKVVANVGSSWTHVLEHSGFDVYRFTAEGGARAWATNGWPSSERFSGVGVARFRLRRAQRTSVDDTADGVLDTLMWRIAGRPAVQHAINQAPISLTATFGSLPFADSLHY